MRDYYKILGVEALSSKEEIKKAYHKLALQFHPDLNANSGEKFLEIHEAYRILGNEVSRKNYDFLLKYASYLINRHHLYHTHHPVPAMNSSSRSTEEPVKSRAYDVVMFCILLILALISLYFSVSDVISKRFDGVTSLSGIVFSFIFTSLLIMGWYEWTRKA